MAETESIKKVAQHDFELARANDFLQEDIALKAFFLLTANEYDQISAHSLGVSL